MKYQVTDFLNQEELLAMLAEESAELSHAALKLRRVMDGTNPTPVGYHLAVKRLQEEIADVFLCIEQIHCVEEDTVNMIRKQKLARWLTRLMDEREKEDAQKHSLE